MNALVWSEAHALQQPLMDQTHREFLELLQRLEAAVDAGAELDPLFAELTAHTEAHFAQEERWLRDLGFADDNCHSMQHGQVLKVVGDVRRTLQEGANDELVRVLVQELGNWFCAHAPMMDAALVEMMAAQGYDPATGRSAQPRAADAEPISGCGSGSCG